eukprot:CAMPEP_0119013954 /NCGR_PEP_ID=MMETSP1176-20130426/9276_1 /TAXON_ID=265551 /ORGANISM="Synedropsis recta cf, Strain CCMP1620" /LENGTH=669 /DNA_ID=CAMNT_0006967085 /DNA_START=73 /DNA_END=2082 /DNA_ORIENTATION=-
MASITTDSGSKSKRVRNTTTDDFRDSLAAEDADGLMMGGGPVGIVPTTISTEDTSSFLSAGEEADDDQQQQQQQHHKRARDELPTNTRSTKRADVLKQRRQTVLQLFQQHSGEKLTTSNKILSRLKDLYRYKVLPIERKYNMHSFCLPTHSEIYDAEFDAKPMVLLVGPYSTGKTTFIQHLIGGEFPGMHIGPEPTTDKFMALVHGNADGVTYEDLSKDDSNHTDGEHHYFTDGDNEDIAKEHTKPETKKLDGKIIKGNTLTVTPELPFASLAEFGSNFLKHFDGSVCASPLLRNLTLIDTPGVLSGQKQRLNRSYNFAEATKWFADRADLILFLFDAHKLDVSDEFKEVVETIRPHNDDKIRCVLNKADSVTREQFVRVYGSLLWSMGKLFNTPEVVRVYTGSYWDEPLKHDDFSSMFETDEWLLIDELMNLPSVSAERKVNAMVKRIRLVKVHVCLLGYLGRQTPRFSSFGGQAQSRKELLANLDKVFAKVCKTYKLAEGDLPNVNEFREALEAFPDWSVFPAPDPTMLRQLDHLIREEIPSIIRHSPAKKAAASRRSVGGGGIRLNSAKNGATKRSTMEEEEDEIPVIQKKNSLSMEATLGLMIAGAVSVLLLVLFVVIPMIITKEPIAGSTTDTIHQFVNNYVYNRLQAEELYGVKIDADPVHEL